MDIRWSRSYRQGGYRSGGYRPDSFWGRRDWRNGLWCCCRCQSRIGSDSDNGGCSQVDIKFSAKPCSTNRSSLMFVHNPELSF
ncbi:hypothetical protein ERIC2_c33790 [Paenibacillus larvae subsp. larvae DSM 25430]|uniref:Uncharacterized protein n=1 Tax=Paenibacillus larvae subsp. larvae DSM 25430 TaxID=697284 RepID=V9WB56_9BACL|nr:hypothetical protein ERIC2_c33790 [Paenibacillus larvae subsp. larvae DSM 25430]